MDSINNGVCVQWSYFISVFIRFTAENLCCGTHIRSVGTVRVYCKNRGACKPEDMIIFKVLCNRLVHISKLDTKRVERVEDVVAVGDAIVVKVTDIDQQGRINLSRRDAILALEAKKNAQQ